MAALSKGSCLVLLMLALAFTCSALAERYRGAGFEVDLGEAREVLRSEGGTMRAWSQDIEAFSDARRHVGVAELELEEDGLLLPQYADADKVAYVLEGRGWMGAALPVQGTFGRTFVRRVNRGDVIALPRGTVYWWYNDEKQAHRVLCAGETTFGTQPGRFQHFGLAGGRAHEQHQMRGRGEQESFGSILHGFSRDTLARAWGIDEGTLSSVLESQREGGIIRSQRKIRFEELERVGERERESESEHRRRRHSSAEEVVDDNVNVVSGGQRHPAAAFDYFEELKYDSRAQQPDLLVRNGGHLQVVNRHKLPALSSVGFSIARGSLDENAIFAPYFIRNAHQIVYVTRGRGRIEVSTGDGQKVFNEEVREGTVLAIPQFFPAVKVAGNEGLEWVSILTSDQPSTSFLAGRNSVFRHIPKQVLMNAWGIDEGTMDELRRGREDEQVIFSGRGEQRRGRRASC